MKKTLIKISALSISVLILATSCTKTGATGPTGANGANGNDGSNLKGNMQGIVSLYDVSGIKMLPSPTSTVDLSGDSIVLTNVSSGTVMKTITNAAGTYTFSNVSAGTYSSSVTRSGYGTVLSYGSQFVGGGTIDKNFELSLIPTTNVVSTVAKDTAIISSGDSIKYVKVRGYVPVSNAETTVIVYVSQAANTFVNTTPGNYSTYYTTTVAAGATKFTIEVPTSSLYDFGFPAGGVSSVYFAVYIMGGNTSASTYTDWSTQQTVFTALSSIPINTSATVQ